MSSAAIALSSDESAWVSSTPPTVIRLEYVLPQLPKSWHLDDEDSMPESNLHHEVVVYLESLLKAWAERFGRPLLVGSNLAIRWDENQPQVGVDPDVYVVEMPPEDYKVSSLCLWKEGHHPPMLAVEVVSPNYTHKDYQEAPLKYAACRVNELWVLDPERSDANDQTDADGFAVQIWQRDAQGLFHQTYAGAGPGYSKVLNAWVKLSPRGRQVHISDDRAGKQRWLTAAQAAHRAQEVERMAKEQALRKIEELQAELARLKK